MARSGTITPRSGLIPAIVSYKEVGGPPGSAKPRTTAITSKSPQTDGDRCNRHAAFTNEIARMSDAGLYSQFSLCIVSRSEQLRTPMRQRGLASTKGPAAPQTRRNDHEDHRQGYRVHAHQGRHSAVDRSDLRSPVAQHLALGRLRGLTGTPSSSSRFSPGPTVG